MARNSSSVSVNCIIGGAPPLNSCSGICGILGRPTRRRGSIDAGEIGTADAAAGIAAAGALGSLDDILARQRGHSCLRS